MPYLVLTLAYYLHMLATVLWIGGLSFQAIVLFPALERSLPANMLPRFLETLRRRFEPWTWLSLAILVGTGLTQMASNQQYEGILMLQNRWSLAIFSKHALFGLMLLAAAYQTWILQPRLTRAAMQQALKSTEQSEEKAHRLLLHGRQLVRLNLTLSLGVLILTAIARTA